MNKNLKIALIIAAVIAVIYFWKKKNSDDSEKSEFLGFFSKKGSQRWADGLARSFCYFRTKLERLLIEINVTMAAGKPVGASTLAQKMYLESELEAILLQLAPYGYGISISSCKAVPKGSNKTYRPGDQLGKDCLCKDKTTWAPECCKAAK